MPKIEPIFTEPNNFGGVTELGAGHFGVVWAYEVSNEKLLVKFKELGLIREGDTKIAVKMIKPQVEERKITDMFVQEAEITQYLFEQLDEEEKKNPSHMLGCRGAIGGNDVIFCRLEKLDNKTEARLNNENARQTIDEDELIKKLSDDFISLMNGMDLLHKRRILHLDIAQRNCLTTPEGNPILGDFGQAVRVPEGSDFSVKVELGTNPVKWMNYDYAVAGIASRASDLYAMKVTLLEAIAHHTKHTSFPEKLSNDQEIVTKYRLQNDSQKLDGLAQEIREKAIQQEAGKFKSLFKSLIVTFSPTVYVTPGSNISEKNYAAEHEKMYKELFKINFEQYLKSNPDQEKIKAYITKMASKLHTLEAKNIFLEFIRDYSQTKSIDVKDAIAEIEKHINKFKQSEQLIKQSEQLIKLANGNIDYFHEQMREVLIEPSDKSPNAQKSNQMLVGRKLSRKMNEQLDRYLEPYRKLAQLQKQALYNYKNIYDFIHHEPYASLIKTCIENRDDFQRFIKKNFSKGEPSNSQLILKLTEFPGSIIESLGDVMKSLDELKDKAENVHPRVDDLKKKMDQFITVMKPEFIKDAQANIIEKCENDLRTHGKGKIADVKKALQALLKHGEDHYRMKDVRYILAELAKKESANEMLEYLQAQPTTIVIQRNRFLDLFTKKKPTIEEKKAALVKALRPLALANQQRPKNTTINTVNTVAPQTQNKAVSNSAGPVNTHPNSPINAPPEPVAISPQPKIKQPSTEDVDVSEKPYYQRLTMIHASTTHQAEIAPVNVSKPSTTQEANTRTSTKKRNSTHLIKESLDDRDAEVTKSISSIISQQPSYTPEQILRIQTKVSEIAKSLNDGLAKSTNSGHYILQLTTNVKLYLVKMKTQYKNNPEVYSKALDILMKLQDSLGASGNYLAVHIFEQARASVFSEVKSPTSHYGRTTQTASNSEVSNHHEDLVKNSKASIAALGKLQAQVTNFNSAMHDLSTNLHEYMRQKLGHKTQTSKKKDFSQLSTDLYNHMQHYQTLYRYTLEIKTPENLMDFMQDSERRNNFFTAMKSCLTDQKAFAQFLKKQKWLDDGIKQHLNTPYELLKTYEEQLCILEKTAPPTVKKDLSVALNDVRHKMAEIHAKTPKRRGDSVFGNMPTRLHKGEGSPPNQSIKK